MEFGSSRHGSSGISQRLDIAVDDGRALKADSLPCPGVMGAGPVSPSPDRYAMRADAATEADPEQAPPACLRDAPVLGRRVQEGPVEEITCFDLTKTRKL